jgi:cobalt-zinc-cadmium efflux system outer membrane protein
MSPASRRALLPLALLAACQYRPASAPPRPPRVSGEVLDRLRLGNSDGAPLAPVHVLGRSPEADVESVDAPSAVLGLEDLLASVERHFPLILAAMEEFEIASGRQMQARGAFDTRFGVGGRFGVEGFYENERVVVGFEQPTTLFGTSFFGGYRLGTGNFPVYEGGAKTNEGGEFRLGFNLPLLQGGAIDPRRVALWRAKIEQELADPTVERRRLEATLQAATAYWRWVAWGRRREIARRLLALADDRQEQVSLAVEEGLLARINLTDNERLIVERRAELVRVERGLQQAAILLSLYWRDSQGQPLVPSERELPYEFPSPVDPGEVLIPDDVALALGRRPEIRAMDLELQALELERQLARNQGLPTLDVGLYASQDVGAAVNLPDDKGPFELEALLRLELPLQFRQPRGRLKEVESRMARLERERQYAKDIVITDVQDSVSALRQSWERLEQARENVRLAIELADAERFQLQVGESDIFRLNLREQQAALAAASLVDVLDEHFRSQARYRAVLGIPYDEVRAERP